MAEQKSKGSNFDRQLSLNDDRWLSVDEICKYLGVSKDTVYKWIDKHNMPAHRIGRLWKLKKEQVDAWLEAGGSASGSEEKNR
ncbi:TPA: helix-turn-helix domain-containing protein [Legionella pneumophila]|nr:helix-turn-helix domain-containing protein [Legionella pneumophila]HCR5123377.1 helix-turn-helix domain-containing protein [Legionella pneumophila]HCR5126417.1 helix-turn-helix domain-containing protein [Legionella pneumophila]HCR5129303.1 helix-turn-helix domain-containing protein [Legionella pneumophila]HCR5132357.1 helix-turn-helix domain-containing protein [Legionella pneumophila]HCR5135584.1 helix-turn-helix domain-containing protein [Legionella pneumophila]